MNETRFIIGRWIAAALAMLGLLVALNNLVVDNMPKGEVREIKDYEPWSEDVLRAAEIIPVQDGGRVKPLSTYAGFTMLKLHGARSMKIDDGAGEEIKIKPTEWLLDTLFRPQFALKQPTFRIDNSKVLEAIDVDLRGRRDRYSYEEIVKGRSKLIELSESYRSIESDYRDPVQQQLIDLASNVQHYEGLFGYFTFARSGIVLAGFSDDGQADKRADMSHIMLAAPQLQQYFRQVEAHGDAANPRLRGMLEQILRAANFSKMRLFFFPPTDAGDEKWSSAGETIMGVMNGSIEDSTAAIEDVVLLENLARSADDQKAFKKALEALQKETSERAGNRDEYKRVKLEAFYYRKDFFLKALVYFLLGSLTALGMWALGRSKPAKWLAWITAGLSVVGLAYSVTAIVMRSWIMQRSPIGNLYDTIIFIAAFVVLLSLIIEALTWKRFALGLGPILGAGLILLARRFEMGDAKDHMDPLVAVLDSNYWLTTHVITITAGYAAGLLSAFLATAYILMRSLGLDRGDQQIRRIITRCVYGMICFTLFLSLVGTVLGGIWANDSWGRFWGWDPKENGALLIVLWTLAILHARLGGYLREWGLHFAALFTAVIVTFSWWHVNFLGVGLHNYGFTAGKDAIWKFYTVMMVLMAFGVVGMVVEKVMAESKKSVS